MNKKVMEFREEAIPLVLFNTEKKSKSPSYSYPPSSL
jgi:hypothetical protein